MVTRVDRESFVGRGAELARLDEMAERCATDGFRVALMVGEAGLGKTRLASEFLERHADTAVGLSARAYPLGGTISFGLWSDALDRHLRALPSEERRNLAAGYAEDLATLLPSLTDADADRGGTREPSRLRLLQGIARVLSVLARRAPVLMVLDDAHLADASSWEMLGYLSRHLDDAPVLVIANVRPAELDANEAGVQTVAALDREGVLDRIAVDPLNRTEVGELAARTMGLSVTSDRLVEWLMERCLGNPLYALGLVDALVAEAVDPTRPHLDGLPEDLAERILVTLGVLDEPTHATLELMALLGQVEIGDLSRLAGRPVGRLAEILDDLVKARLATEQRRGSEIVYEIFHPLIQEAIYDSIGAARRRALHRRVARELAAMGRAAAAAPHFARGADPGDEEAIDALLDAMREAESREAYREAFMVQEAMLEIIPAGDDRWLDVLEAMGGQASWLSDHRADVNAVTGVRVLERILTLLEQGEHRDPARLGTVYFRLASFLTWDVDDISGAEEACVQARDRFREAGDEESALRAEFELAFARGRTRSVPEWLTEARAALASAEAAGDELVTMMALGQTAIAAEWTGRLSEAEDLYRRSIDIARRRRQAYRLSWNLSHFAVSLALQGHCGEGTKAIEEARRSYPAVWETLVPWGSWVAWLGGDLRASVDAAREYLSWGQGPVAIRQAPAVVASAAAAVEADLVDEAEYLLGLTTASFGGHPFFGVDALTQWVQGLIDHAEGDPASAMEQFDRAGRALLDNGASVFAALVLSDLAETAAASGDADGSAASAATLAEVAASVDRPVYGGLAALARGWAALAGGDAAAAGDAAGQALGLLGTAEWPLFDARARELSGRALVRSDRAAAASTLRDVAETYREIGAVRRADAVSRDLEGLGHAGRRSAASVGPAALSSREREIARLTVSGLTAREIADQLFIGRRTVETHLSNAYAKLGVTSKRELVRRAHDFHL